MKRNLVKRVAAAMLVAVMAVTVVPMSETTTVKAEVPTEGDVVAEFNTDIITNFTSKYTSRHLTFIPTENGYGSVTLAPYSAQTAGTTLFGIGGGAYTSFKVYDDTGRSYFKNAEWYSSYNLPDMALTKGRKYYVDISIFRGMNYQNVLRWTFTPSDTWEVESNDSANQATLMKEKTVYTGTRCVADDFDCFKLVLNKDRQVTFKFGPADVGGNGRWITYLRNEKGEDSSDFGNDIKTEIENTVNLKKGTYYYCIGGYKNTTGVKYNLSYSTAPINSIPVPKVGSLSGYRYKNNAFYNKQFAHLDYLSLKKVGTSVIGYRVKVANKKNMKGVVFDKVIDAAEEDKTIVRLDSDFRFSKKVAYVTVQPYVKDPFGHEIWGKRSKVKTVKLSLKK